ncbi:DinB family protein [Zafaria sp. Z1313]|uniref:DinB family protein n=1 Tax=unclassified Zafaria TaxID=2828765 RepID=UPI002E7A1878|nr:DinB family protein [Zafaria sp. J156]MEE1619835.1 DinB family protein [Zafaria sp. J156]
MSGAGGPRSGEHGEGAERDGAQHDGAARDGAEQDGIVPDLKDWTWTLDRACPECGADVRGLSPQDVAALVRESLPRWQRALLAGPELVRRRPAPGTWSTLEYAAHVRDVFRVMHYRLDLMLTRESPEFPNWDQDATAVEEDYAGQDPRTVATQLAAAGRGFADGLDAVLGRELARAGLRGNGSVFTVETLARYAWHDVAHHLYDVGA